MFFWEKSTNMAILQIKIICYQGQLKWSSYAILICSIKHILGFIYFWNNIVYH